MKIIFSLFFTVLLQIFISNNAHALGCNGYETYQIDVGGSIDVLTSATDKYCVLINNITTTEIVYIGHSMSEYYVSLQKEQARGNISLSDFGADNLSYKSLRTHSFISIVIGNSPLAFENDSSTYMPHNVHVTAEVQDNKTVVMVFLASADTYDSTATSSSNSLQSFSTSTSTADENCSADNTSPDDKPVHANLNANIRRMIDMNETLDSVQMDTPVKELWKYLWFKNIVQKGSVMDYKKFDSIYEDYGNYNYGAVGRALGIPTQVLLRAAGWAQMNDGTSNRDWGHYLLGTPYGDDPNDQAWIEKGIDYYEEVFSSQSVDTQNNAGKNGVTDFCNSNHNEEPDDNEDEADDGFGYDGGSNSYGANDYYIPPNIMYCADGLCYNYCVGYVTITDL